MKVSNLVSSICKIIILVFYFALLSCASISVKDQPTPAQPVAIKLFKESVKLHKKKDLKTAIRSFKKVIQLDPNSSLADDSYMILGDIYVAQSMDQQAYLSYLNIIKQNVVSPKEGTAYKKAAAALFRLGKTEEALSLFDKGGHSPHISSKEQVDLLESKALYQEKSGDYFSAVKDYQSAWMRSQGTKKQIKIKSKIQRIVEARLNIEDLQKFATSEVKEDFKDLKVYASYRVSLYYFKNKNFDTAKEFAENIINIAPNSTTASKAQELIKQFTDVGQTDPQTVGVILPLSGKYGPYGQKVLQAIQLGFGVFGDSLSSLNLSIIDSESHSDVARKGVETLVLKDQVIAIVGGLLAKTATAIAEKSEQMNVPHITLSQKSGLTEVGPNIFRNALTSQLQAQQLVKVAMEQGGIKKFGILYPNDSYGVEYSNVFWSEVRARGGEIVAAQSYDPKSGKISDAIKRLMGTYYIEDRKEEYQQRLRSWLAKQGKRGRKNPPEDLLPPAVKFRALFIPDNTKALGQIAPTLAYYNVKDVKLLGTNVWKSPSLIRRGGKYVEGALFVDDTPSFQKKKGGFFKAYKKHFKESPTPLAVRSYDVALWLRQALSSGPSSRSDLRQHLLQTSSFEGAYSSAHLNEKREWVYPVIPLTVRNKRIRPFHSSKK